MNAKSLSLQTRLLSTEYSRMLTPIPMVFRLLPNFSISCLKMTAGFLFQIST